MLDKRTAHVGEAFIRYNFCVQRTQDLRCAFRKLVVQFKSLAHVGGPFIRHDLRVQHTQDLRCVFWKPAVQFKSPAHVGKAFEPDNLILACAV